MLRCFELYRCSTNAASAKIKFGNVWTVIAGFSPLLVAASAKVNYANADDRTSQTIVDCI